MFIISFITCVINILTENFVPLNDVHQYNTRSSRYNFLVPHCRGVDKSTFYYTGIIDWSSIQERFK